MRIDVSPQVAGFLRSLAPHSRHLLRSGLQELGEGRGDILELEHPLDGFYRLRVGRYRVIFRHTKVRGAPAVRCEFAQRRELVYETFADLVTRLMQE
ncbi:MAG: type II toxin-antitoxin system RelE family toxin [Kiritimatiellia bacterium]